MNVLFVCTGNTCRSPMAEGYLNSRNIKDILVKSRGLAVCDINASPKSEAAMLEIGIDIKNHVPTQISKQDIEWADRIICMSESHALMLEPVAKQKLFVLAGGIADPFGMDIEAYRACRNQIISAIDMLFPQITVRLAEREDIASIVKLEKVCFSEPWSEEFILSSLKNGTKFFVAQKGNAVLGYAGISCIVDEGYITNIAVFPEHRNKGVATALLNRIFALAEDLSLAFVSLEVRVSNLGAVSLYEKEGFKTEARRPNFYTNPQEDAYIMTKRFE